MHKIAKSLRFTILLVLIVGLLFSIPGCSGGGSSAKTLTIAILADPGTADGQLTTEDYLLPINIFDRLVEVQTTGPGKSELAPGLAQSWEASADSLTYTFHLRQGAKFTNGEELTADDVVYTFDRMLNPATKALNTDFLDMIKGAQDRLDGKATSTAGLKVVDKYTVQITLNTPFAPFLAGLAVPGCSIYNKKATEAAGEKFGTAPVGTGPFMVKKWTYNSEIILAANPNYFRGKAALDQLVVKIIPDPETQRMMFETKKIDVFDLDNATSQIPYFRDNATWKNQIVSGPRVGTTYYALNQAIKPLDNLKVRQAIQYAIDRKQLIEKLYYNTGSPAKGILAPGLAGYNPNLPGFAFDQTKARQLLAEAGLSNGFATEIWQTTDSPDTLRRNEAVQAMLGQIGIKVTIKQVDSAAWSAARKAGQIPMYTTNWSADFNDPDNFLYTFFGSNNAVTRGFNYSNPRVTEILNQCRVLTDNAKRYALYQEAEKIAVYDDAAFVPLYHSDHLFVVQPWVKNFKVSWNGWSNMPYYGIAVDPALKK